MSLSIVVENTTKRILPKSFPPTIFLNLYSSCVIHYEVRSTSKDLLLISNNLPQPHPIDVFHILNHHPPSLAPNFLAMTCFKGILSLKQISGPIYQGEPCLECEDSWCQDLHSFCSIEQQTSYLNGSFFYKPPPSSKEVPLNITIHIFSQLAIYNQACQESWLNFSFSSLPLY